MMIAISSFGMSIFVSIFCWLHGRPKKWCLPSDFFYIGCLILVGLAPLINLYGQSEYALNYQFGDETVSSTLYGISLMFLSFSLVWLGRRKLIINEIAPKSSSIKGRILEMLAFSFIGLLTIVSVIDPATLAFKIKVLSFLTGNLSGVEYQALRRGGVISSPILSLLAYFRFSLIALFFTIASIYVFERFSMLVSVFFIFALYLVCASSVSKMPFIVFAAYAFIAHRLIFSSANLFNIGRITFILAVGLSFVTLTLTIFYLVQYPEVYYFNFDGLSGAFSLSMFRVFGAVYNGLLMFFEVYPNYLPHSYLSESSLLSSIFGVDVRDLSVEVPVFFLGPILGSLTSFPTIFIGSAYASLGYFGVVLFSLAAASWVCLIDEILASVRSPQLRIALYSTMSVNVMFLCTQSALTAFLTYGVVVTPILVYLLDRVIVYRRARSGDGVPDL